jgi:membrane AbrB-like protein
LLRAAGLSGATIVAALFVGVAVALWKPGRMQIHSRGGEVAQAAIGTVLGSTLSVAALGEVGSNWAAVLVTTVAIAGLGLAIGAFTQRTTGVDPATAILAAVPGGAVGLVAMTRDLGGDDRMVALSQYLRVLVVFASTPIIVATLLKDHGAPGIAVAAATGPGVGGTLLAIAVGAAGWAVAVQLRIAGAALLGALVAAAVCAMVLPAGSFGLPAPLREIAFAALGLDVGLRFDRHALRTARRLLPAFVGGLSVLLLGCFALALVMREMTDMTLLDAYLATTPGGLSVVGATAYSTGGDMGLVVAVQAFRLVLMVLLAPVAVTLALRALKRGSRVPPPVAP